MFVKLWIIFLKGRKQKNMIWNHLEKKQGGKTYSDTSLLFWQPWWVPVLWRSFHLGNVVIFIDERTLPSSAIQACRMLAGLLISKDAQWWRVCLQRRSQPSWFLPNSEWRNIPKKRCVGNKYGFQYIYIYTLSYDCFDLWHRYLLIVCHLWIENQRFSFNEYNVCVLVLVSDFPSVTHRKSNNFAGDAIKRADKFTQSPKT